MVGLPMLILSKILKYIMYQCTITTIILVVFFINLRTANSLHKYTYDRLKYSNNLKRVLYIYLCEHISIPVHALVRITGKLDQQNICYSIKNMRSNLITAWHSHHTDLVTAAIWSKWFKETEDLRCNKILTSLNPWIDVKKTHIVIPVYHNPNECLYGNCLDVDNFSGILYW